MNSLTSKATLFALPTDQPYGLDRLDRLASYDLNGTAIEPVFDQLAALGAQLLAVPVCMVSVFGHDEQVFIGRFGMAARNIPRTLSFCNDTLRGGNAVHVVPDLSADDRYRMHPFVQPPGNTRFYAGTLLLDRDGMPVGSFCILDHTPRADFSDDARALLVRLAAIAAGALDARRNRLTGAAGQRFVETTTMAVITADHNGRITFWNAAAEAIFGHPAHEAIGRNLMLIVPERFRDAHQVGLARLVRGGVPTLAGKTVEVQALHRDDREFPIEMTLSYWNGPSGQGFGAHILDISARRAREARLQHLAHHDELTGLLNRRGFMECVERCLADQGRATVLALDLDMFKAVNDAFGHAVGDAFLQALSVRLTTAITGDASLGRIGGDEFAVLLTGDTGLVRATDVARAILRALRDPIIIAQHDLQVGVSIGIAVAPIHATDADELMIRADLALFRAKHEGGRAYRIFDSGMGADLAANRAFKMEIGRAMANGEWELLYQPQVALHSGRLVGTEALLRWRHPKRGMLPPAAFLPLLETHAAAFEVGCWVIDQACARIRDWRAAGLSIDRISVNLFAAQIRAGNLEDIVLSALERHGLQPTDLELEITETIALRHDGELEPLRALHAAGVAIAFDDFGTGFASLATLKNFPLSRLKIDRSFVTDIVTDPHSAAIVEGVIAIGHRLDLTVIAEGIETGPQERVLLSLGCDEGQGYLYGRPMTGADILARFAARTRPALIHTLFPI
ncbi:putative bifunctional diguanylate cyclase/phosphodiesterase [Sphingomonas montana]|uniref:putative bifunctional diguanylate cyclase/phosphodiesterase n=1 Tax=Sphingomonas montana TaxID=1843236 RepID=UPI0013ED50D8|nr:EAL domain-containing protein [Sphingomonas montana]